MCTLSKNFVYLGYFFPQVAALSRQTKNDEAFFQELYSKGVRLSDISSMATG
jgi:hypothetical protein